MTRKVILSGDGVPETLPNKEDIENLKLEGYGKSFFCIREEDLLSEKTNHLIYKLHQIDAEFIWVAMWNNYSFIKEPIRKNDYREYKKWVTIQEPIKYVLESGYKVIRADSQTINSIRWAMERKSH